MLQQNGIWLVTLAMFCGLLLWAAITDFRHYIIPNQASLGALVLYPIFVMAAPHPVPWTIALVIAAVFFVIGFILYLTRTMGAGDAKMLPVVVLWVGPDQVGTFVLAIAFASIVLALVIGLKSSIAFTREEAAAQAAGAPNGGAGAAVGAMAPGGISRVFRVVGNLRHVPFLKLQMPYGVAIAAGGIVVSVNAVFTVLR